jgi:hypothetical protein
MCRFVWSQSSQSSALASNASKMRFGGLGGPFPPVPMYHPITEPGSLPPANDGLADITPGS